MGVGVQGSDLGLAGDSRWGRTKRNAKERKRRKGGRLRRKQLSRALKLMQGVDLRFNLSLEFWHEI